MSYCKRLIEVAMPVKEVSFESVRDKSIRHGHISTLHLWWARRPLPVSRAVIFASLVFDPLDKECPKQYIEACKQLLSTHEYKPYEDIPFTAEIDPMEDNLRNRLLTFIGKFSKKFLEVEKTGKGKCDPKETIDPASLIKWENKNNEKIINIARKLIWVAHDPINNTLEEFDKYYLAIKTAEEKLYTTPDRHQSNKTVNQLETDLNNAIETFLNRMPKVFDPFAGGGAIPLEAARLGCKTYANDLNPVAHIIEKASTEYPQKYGKPIIYSKEEFVKIYGQTSFDNISTDQLTYQEGQISGVRITNRLAFDVEYYCNKLLNETEKELGHLYPADDKGNKPVAYIWAKVGTCANPSCKAEVPLLRGMYLCNKPDKQIHLEPVIKSNKIDFEIKKGTNDASWMTRGNLKCPCCGNITDVSTLKDQFIVGNIEHRMLAVIHEGKNSKNYTLPTEKDLAFLDQLPENLEKPSELMPIKYTQAFPSCTWGLHKWGQMFSDRPILLMNTLIKNTKSTSFYTEDNDYCKALRVYLGLFIDRLAAVQTSFGRWHTGRENIEHPFGRQAIPMVFDYPESNPFCDSSGSARNHIDWIVRYITEESDRPFSVICNNAASGDHSQFKQGFLTASITDPPYYDAIAYADLSDFFYIWLKKTIGEYFPETFAYPMTPKTDECTALKHHHNNNEAAAKKHFEDKLLQIFKVINQQTENNGLVSIMFAHQSTEAWTTLCNSILNAEMNISGSWPFDSEMSSRMVAIDSMALTSSVTVSCRKRVTIGAGDFKDVRKEVEDRVKKSVNELYGYGFRGADLLTGCFGPAVSEFGKYSSVEKASGDQVTVQELLELSREAAFNAIISDIDTDDYTRFYIGWLNLFGYSAAEHDDVRRISQIGLHLDINDLISKHILVRQDDKESLASVELRISLNAKLGEEKNTPMLDRVHRGMILFKGHRKDIVSWVAKHAPSSDHEFWRVLTALTEVLPIALPDGKLASGLLVEKEALIKDAKQFKENTVVQESMF